MFPLALTSGIGQGFCGSSGLAGVTRWCSVATDATAVLHAKPLMVRREITSNPTASP